MIVCQMCEGAGVRMVNSGCQLSVRLCRECLGVGEIANRCRWCDRLTDNHSRKCDECLQDIENDRRIDAARGK